MTQTLFACGCVEFDGTRAVRDCTEGHTGFVGHTGFFAETPAELPTEPEPEPDDEPKTVKKATKKK